MLFLARAFYYALNALCFAKPKKCINKVNIKNCSNKLDLLFDLKLYYLIIT